MNKKFLACSAIFVSLFVANTLSAQEKAVEKSAKLSVYRVTPAKINDLVHTKLDVSFDYAKRYLYGKELGDVKASFLCYRFINA
ncbi:hypothetical protein [Pedobacter agri]|uniref:hypothetical protein n=1 Tax=Pedobacter agri TaxID=454586 RepID=UPI00278A8651|nr:hypothetical protein [Pedobacter agri]MDQ1140623.1 hypothetical protein [Pedobacter agri]